MDQETMSTPDLVNPTNESVCTLDESSQKKVVKILNLRLQYMKARKWNQNTTSFCYCRIRTRPGRRGEGEWNVTNLSALAPSTL